ncbi:HAD-superfamily hydrolase, subfamily IA, variant 3 [Hydrogenobacter thermophilus TK-6]|uniref:phosphoglycolate phosphatase n=1 Tax=Hydrogenobacter thermophilus (strain DSM 6534 / IAM 12695 / TK-6) TaxID=608538 RepID=D3DHD4_HYDTT|nr:HAD-IA family hydrolase [Hydrogenobacter thermophilus]ADO45174.1 HAD-superfamily hydrolase, subfamily IA, variant 3 [Hydrogenobacter thermophilus TK-6]BAI69236.1 phosphoglycolate phosphatase [Hydrogenobacter thermophilus TK-6]
MRLKLFIFDLDGTLIDSYMDIGMCVNGVLRSMGRQEIEPDSVKNWIGGGARGLLEKLFPSEEIDRALELFRKYYRENPVVYTKAYKGIREVLTHLKAMEKRLAVVTNKMEDLSVEILKRLNLYHYFDMVVGGDTFPEKKPSPVPIKEVLRWLGVDAKEAVMIGDTDADVRAGKDAGVWTALANWGYVRMDGVKPDFVLHKPEDIINLPGRA